MERSRAGVTQLEKVPEASKARAEELPPRKQIYLRTVYPLNPGIPHFIDVPGGW